MSNNNKERKNYLEDVPYVDLKSIELDRETAKNLDEEISRKIEGIVIGKPDEATLAIAVTEPKRIDIYDIVSYASENKFRAVLLKADPEMIELAQEFVYNTPQAVENVPWKEWLEQKRYFGKKLDVKSSGVMDKDLTGAVIDKAGKIIVEAISTNASDIHIEPFEDRMLVRYRIDGVLHLVDEITDKDEASALVKRFKIMSNMDIALDRVTQGGRMSVEVAGRAFDLRVSIVPVPDGESLVLRLLSKSAFNLSLETLGFDGNMLSVWQQMVSRPYGIILVCGPTGSGKSTTLYASLKEINRPDRKILTVEDPIEYRMPGIIQVQVSLAPKDDDKKVTFARALREFLRQDPDVILVGEIRDEETASISVKAALTGHLVLSTVHTNDAVGIITRLKDMNLAPYLISATLLGGMAQRLVRKLCPSCKKPASVPEEFEKFIEAEKMEDLSFFDAVGCDNCRRSGYKGRIALFETLVMTDELRDKVEIGATAGEIRSIARSQGMKFLLEDGMRKAAAGVTSADEVRRVCMMDIAI